MLRWCSPHKEEDNAQQADEDEEELHWENRSIMGALLHVASPMANCMLPGTDTPLANCMSRVTKPRLAVLGESYPRTQHNMLPEAVLWEFECASCFTWCQCIACSRAELSLPALGIQCPAGLAAEIAVGQHLLQWSWVAADPLRMPPHTAAECHTSPAQHMVSQEVASG